jgi:plastocyanin
MRKMTFAGVLLAASLVVACSQQSSYSSSPVAPSASLDSQGGGGALAATMIFGIDTIGSPFPPASGHDQSGHSRDNLVPRTVVIDAGGTVTFQMGVSGVHAIAIYNPGKEPGDVNVGVTEAAPAGCPPPRLINDAVNRLAVVGSAVCAGGSPAPTYTFTAPGKYLVICRLVPHFNVGMYGWVIVRDR